MPTIVSLAKVTVDANDLEILVRQAHQIVTVDYNVGLAPDGRILDGGECGCGALFLSTPDRWFQGQHQDHVTRAVREAMNGRLR